MITLIPETIEDYARAHTIKESDLLQRLVKETYKETDLPEMQVGHLEGAFLRLLVQITNAKRILEIGTFTGYSTLVMAEGLPKDGEIITLDINPDTTNIAKKYWVESPHGKKIKSILAPALDSIKNLTGLFDMVFIDADKENYINYFEACLPKVRQGGLIVADNVLWSGKVLNPKEKSDIAITEFNKHIINDRRVEAVMLTVRDGLMLAYKL